MSTTHHSRRSGRTSRSSSSSPAVRDPARPTRSCARTGTLAANSRFAVIDTENGRAKHYADDYDFDHVSLESAVLTGAVRRGALRDRRARVRRVIVDDSSTSTSRSAVSSIFRRQEFARMGGKGAPDGLVDPAEVEASEVRAAAPEVRSHVILNLGAEDKVEVVKVPTGEDRRSAEGDPDGRSRLGADLRIPLPFEATISLLFTADAPGVPKPIKLRSGMRRSCRWIARLTSRSGCRSPSGLLAVLCRSVRPSRRRSWMSISRRKHGCSSTPSSRSARRAGTARLSRGRSGRM